MSFAVRSARLLSSRALRHIQKRGYADEMAFTLAAANQVFYNAANVRQVDVPSFSGSFGILPKHVPTLGELQRPLKDCSNKNLFPFFLAVLKPGVVTVYENDGTNKKIFVSSGTITVNEDSSVQVLVEEAHPVEALDLSAAREVLSQSQSELSQASSDKVRKMSFKSLKKFNFIGK